MALLTEKVRTKTERGIIVGVLVDWGLEWVPYREVKLQLIRRVGYMVDDAQVGEHLDYLEHSGYAEVKTLCIERKKLNLKAIRGTPKAVDLVEGRALDPGVGF